MRCNPFPPSILTVFLFVASTAAAQSERIDKAGSNQSHYHGLVRQAVDQYERGNYEEAKVLFTEAHKTQPNARTLRGLGMVAYAMRDYVQAIPYLEAALGNRVKPLTPPLVAEAQQVIARARTFIGLVRLTLDPPDAQVTVNAWRVAPKPDGTLSLNPGPHEIAATAPGHRTATRLVRVEPGATLEVDLRLSRNRIDVSENPRSGGAPEVVASESAAPIWQKDPSRARDRSTSIARWIVVGASAAVAIGGGVLLGIALSDVAEVENAEPTTDWSEVESQYDRAPGLSTAGIVMIAAGAAGVAAGLTWHLLDDGEPEEVGLRISPLALQLNGNF